MMVLAIAGFEAGAFGLLFTLFLLICGVYSAWRNR